ncbi:nucleolar protein 12 [Malania oleifera]|uniref:nucleolar protein 12 n=1 Tax=Malania oleifera TaxID=397392 RepID=UPI0025AE0FE1|nr:nucleolar protein 12 [Malania oleifera]
MGRKKKHKDAEKNGKNESPPASTVFKTLFGEIPEQDVSTSIFSESNPFRRKPSDRTQKFGSDEALEDTANGVSENPLAHEMKKRKRGGEENAGAGPYSVEGGSDNVLESAKAKKVKGKTPDLDFEMRGKLKKGQGETLNLDFELNRKKGKSPDMGIVVKGMRTLDIETEGQSRDLDTGEEKRKKKKRKRDEIEREYEERMYGPPDKVEGQEWGLGGKAVGEKRKTVDNPADMLVSKEGFDDENKLLRTVFVGNLPLKMKKKALLKEFSQFGDVESVRIRSVPILDSKTPRKGAILQKKINESVNSVHAYIVFRTEQSAEASLAHNMSVVGGNHIRVDRACPPRKRMKGENAPHYDNKRTVFVGNLPYDVQDEEIYRFFCNIKHLESSIEAVRVIRDPHTSVGRGIAYVLFKTRDAANSVVKRNLKLRDRELRLCHAKADSTPSKRKHQSPSRADDSSGKKLAMASSAHQGSDWRGKAKAAISYQGLQAGKSGAQRTASPKMKPMNSKPRSQSGKKVNESKQKRPAVAARKAAARVANAQKSGGASKVTGQKRKLEKRTPDSSHRSKKSKKLR